MKKSSIRDNIETNIIRGKINKKSYEKIKKDEAKVKNCIIKNIHEEDINILTDTGINIVKDKSKLIEWKKLKLEVKIEKLKILLIKNMKIFQKNY